MYSQVVHQASGIRRFWFGVSLLPPLIYNLERQSRILANFGTTVSIIINLERQS